MRKRILWLSVVSAAVLSQAQVSTRIKWACIGNSITEGTAGATNTYPVRLATRLLMDTVQNDGVGWRTLLRTGDSTYWKYGKFSQVFAFQPNIISIKLGTNDSKPLNWKDSVNFLRDLRDMIDTLSNNITPKPRIFLIYPTPVWKNEAGTQRSDLIRESVIRYSIIPKIRQVAIERGLDTIDLHTPFLNRQNLFPDSIHPNAAGYDSVAAYIFRAYISKVNRIAVVGNSITEYTNSGVSGALAVDAYTVKLNMLLGRDFYAENDGRSGCYMQKPAGITPAIMSYWNQGKLANVFALKPHIITVMLGTNDSRPKAWNTARYIQDAKALIDTLANNINPKPQIWLIRPIGAWKVNGNWGFSNPSGTTDNGISGDIIRDSVIPAILQVAAAKGLPTIDLYNSAFNAVNQPTTIMSGDGVHPNKAGQDTIAHIIYRAFQASTAVKAPGARARESLRTMTRGGNLYVTLPEAAAGRLSIRNLKGATLKSKWARGGVATLSVGGMRPGVYLLVFDGSKGRIAKRFTVASGAW